MPSLNPLQQLMSKPAEIKEISDVITTSSVDTHTYHKNDAQYCQPPTKVRCWSPLKLHPAVRGKLKCNALYLAPVKNTNIQNWVNSHPNKLTSLVLYYFLSLHKEPSRIWFRLGKLYLQSFFCRWNLHWIFLTVVPSISFSVFSCIAKVSANNIMKTNPK